MLKITLCVALFLTSSVAVAEIRIDAPDSGASVPLPFLIEGRAEPGQSLRLRVDGEDVLVFRADDAGRFRVPVDIAAPTYSIEALEGEDAATLTLEPVRPQAQVTPPIERPRIPRAQDPNTMVYFSGTVAPAPNVWGTGATVAAQMVVGGIAGLAGGTLGGVMGYTMLEPAFDWPTGRPLPGAPTVVPLVIGYVALSSITVWALGQASGRRSPFWATLLGSVSGTLLSVVAPPAAVVFVPAGATAGYHLATRR